jgi:hypothetical protein
MPYPYFLAKRGGLPRAVMLRAAPSPFAVTLPAVLVMKTKSTVPPDTDSGELTPLGDRASRYDMPMPNNQ